MKYVFLLIYRFCLKRFLFCEGVSEMSPCMYIDIHVKYPIFLSDFNKTRIFSIDFRKNIQMSNLLKMNPVGSEFFHVDRRTDRHQVANSRFSQFHKHALKPDHILL
jgi:hypothetical protein